MLYSCTHMATVSIKGRQFYMKAMCPNKDKRRI